MRIVFATDGSRGAGVAEDFLLSLPLSCADSVTVVTAVGASERDASALLSRCRWRFAGRDIIVATALRVGPPADVADAVAFEQVADLIVVGSRGLGQLTGALLGSVGRALTREGVTPVLVVRARRDAPHRVLLAIDDSAQARPAVDLLAKLPLPAAADVNVLRVLDRQSRDERTDLAIAHAHAALRDRIRGEDFVDGAHAAESVARTALDLRADLIVVGIAGRSLRASRTTS